MKICFIRIFAVIGFLKFRCRPVFCHFRSMIFQMSNFTIFKSALPCPVLRRNPKNVGTGVLDCPRKKKKALQLQSLLIIKLLPEPNPM